MWIIEWTQPGQQGIGITLFNTRDDAQANACALIMDIIHNEWDLGDTDYCTAAQVISDECAAMNFQAAIDAYNEWEGEGDYEMSQFFRVYERKPITKMPTIHLLQAVNQNHISTMPAPPPIEELVYVTTTPGATCRGPCKTYNEYAYADKSDGTHCCYQCKYMSEVFGGKAP